MTDRILGRTGSPKRRRFLLGSMLSTALLALFLTAGAQAVHDTGIFQLDRNALTSDDAGAVPAAHDWDQICKQATGGAQCASAPGSAGTTVVSFDTDAVNASIFTGGGSKDPHDISDWLYKDGSVPDKDDLLHGFAARYSAPADTTPPTLCPVNPPSTSCELLYFGADRFDASGDAQIGFWFFQNKIQTTTNASGGGFTFSGVHKDGDILVLSDFTQGGGTPNIKILMWNSASDPTIPGGGTGKCSGNPKDCDNLIVLGGGESPADCIGPPTVGAGDGFCATVNNDPETAPWTFLNKSGSANFDPGEFYEGGINLSTLPFGVASECFASFSVETRSSADADAVLKDFVLGSFAACGSKTETTPLDGAGNPITGPLSIGTGSVSVKDRAVVTVSGTSTFDGNVTFFLCKLGAGTCDDSDAAHHGTQIGSAQSIGPPSPVTVTSDTATVTSAGRYCWRAVYSGDAAQGVPPSSDSRESECFTVNPVTPTLTTTATPSVVIGNPIDDVAHLGGTSRQPGDPIINGPLGALANGTITFSLYGPSPTPSCSTAIATRVVTVSGDGDYTASSGTGSGSLTPTAPGNYYWIAVYSGNLPNTLGTSTSCGDAGETTQVTDTTSVSTAQNWLPNDSATISSTGGSALDGSVTFTLYNNGTCDPGTGNANVLYTEGPIAVSGSSPQTRNTNNTTVKVSATATVSWRAVYTSNNQSVGGSSSNCETTVLTITN